MNELKLDLGCGDKCKEGFEGADKKAYGQKYILDLENDMQWRKYLENNSVDEIFSSHLAEHIKNINLFMYHVFRVLKPTGKAFFVVPYYLWEGAYRDPSHVRFFTENTFKYFNKEYAKAVNYNMEYDFDFDIIDIDIVFGRELKCQLKPRK